MKPITTEGIYVEQPCPITDSKTVQGFQRH